MNQLKYSVIYIGSDANTHFKDDHLPWQTLPDASSASIKFKFTPMQKAEEIGFLHLPAGYSSDWHPAPAKQFVMVLTGIMEVEAGDGEKRTFTPGSVLLVTDVEGKGHRTNVLGSQEVLIVWVPIQ
jgi:quercetin dioxygenase-like cupin family protein